MTTAEEQVKYLLSLVPKGIKFGLKNISTVLDHLDNPQLKIQSIHIAGTNGKGSTAAFCESILRSAGYRVGLYTSPHLIHFSERIQINRIPLPEYDMIDLVTRVRKVVENHNISITFFEFATAMGFLYFAEKKTDINIIEVGMGGRLDATNLCKGNISILTSISYDHSQYLGSNIEEIAFEKASIIKKGGMVFAVNENKKVVDVIKGMAAKKEAKLYFLGEHVKIDKKKSALRSQSFTYSFGVWCFKQLNLSLIGGFQADNAALAISACLQHGLNNGCKLSEESIKVGLNTTRWDGRMEVISKNPTVILDAAHNTSAVMKMTNSIQEMFSYAKVIIVLGLMKDKESNEIIRILSEFGNQFILVKPNQKRSESPNELKKRLIKHKVPCEVIKSIPDAIRKVKQIAKTDDIVCITGSIFTVSEAKQSIENETNYNPNLSPPTNFHLNR